MCSITVDEKSSVGERLVQGSHCGHACRHILLTKLLMCIGLGNVILPFCFPIVHMNLHLNYYESSSRIVAGEFIGNCGHDSYRNAMPPEGVLIMPSLDALHGEPRIE